MAMKLARSHHPLQHHQIPFSQPASLGLRVEADGQFLNQRISGEAALVQAGVHQLPAGQLESVVLLCLVLAHHEVVVVGVRMDGHFGGIVVLLLVALHVVEPGCYDFGRGIVGDVHHLCAVGKFEVEGLEFVFGLEVRDAAGGCFFFMLVLCL